MRCLVVFESLYGATHAVADAVGEGLRAAVPDAVVEVVPVVEATGDRIAAAELLVVGGPTHIHGMTTTTSRHKAVEVAQAQGEPELDEAATGPGLRDWFDGLRGRNAAAAAFDTRFDGPAVLTGRASRGIAQRLRRHHFDVVAEPESFIVDKENHLLDGEVERARAWGATLAARAVAGLSSRS